MTSDAVPVWDMGKLQSFHPQLTLTSSAPPSEVLTLLEAGLRDASFKIKKRSATGFQARYVDWVDLIAGGMNKTTLTVEVAPDRTGTSVVITGETLDSDKGGRERVAQGLSTAVDALRVRGFETTASPWRAADGEQS